MKTIYYLAFLPLVTSFITSTASGIEPIVLSTLDNTSEDTDAFGFPTFSDSSEKLQLVSHCSVACDCEPACGCEPSCGFEPTCGCGAASPVGTCRQNYVSLFGGWNFLHDYEADFPLPPATAPASLTFEDGYVLGGALGRRFGSMLRGEVEFAFRNNSAETWNLTGAATFPNDGNADFYSIMFNSLLDLGTYRNWTPYIGGGIGIGFIDYNGVAIAGPASVSIEDEVFSYQGIVGLTRPINSRISLFSEYRYFGFDSAEVNVTGVPAAGETAGSTDVENVLFGLRMSF